MAALKTATQESHEQLEAVFPWEQAFSSRENYVQLLRALDALIRSADKALAGYLSVEGPDAGERRRADWLADDLRRLGDDPENVASTNDFWFVTSPGRALGVLYVLEGSALGAQTLSRQLEARLGITAETGGRYLAAYAERTGARWRAFQGWLNAELNSPELLNDAIFGSLQTFERFSERLTGLFDDR